MKALLLLALFSSNLYALTISDIEKERGKYADQKIALEGIITKLKINKTKYNKFYQFTLKDKVNKEFVKVKYYLRYHDEKINEKFDCVEGQAIHISGNFYAKPKGKKLGELLVQNKMEAICKDDDSYKKIKTSYNLSTLESNRINANKKMIKVAGYINKLRINHNSKKTTASLNLIEQGKKLNLKVSILISIGDQKPINDFHCAEGQYLTLTGAYLANLKSKKALGAITIISKELLSCGTDKLKLTKKDKILMKKRASTEKKQRLNILFRKYKKYYKSKKNKFVQEDFTRVYNEMKEICKEGIKDPKLSLKCVTISYYARTVEQRNQLSFRINSTRKNFADWDQLKAYKVSEKNSILEIVKALYPQDSDYVIGIPKRCFPDQQFNPSASNFPYRELKVSKYAKDNFTAILHKFNDPALKCGNLMDSIFMIGNMDSDKNLEVIKIDLYKKNLIKVIKSDI